MPLSAWLILAALLATPDDPPKGEPAPDEGDPAVTDARKFMYTTDEAIALFERRVALNPRNYLALTTLGDLYERKARETDDLAYYARAEDVLRRAVPLAPPGYVRPKASLAAILCDRHKFAEGLALAREVAKADPRSIDALVTIGDALIELGRYDEAEASYRELQRKLPVPPSHARMAHLAELKGQTDEAVALLRRAIDEAKTLGGTPDNLAWFRVRLADLLFDAGRLDEAEGIYEAVLKEVPKHHDATAGLARARAARGRDREAIALYEKAVAIAPDPAMLAALGDLYAKAGDTARASACYDRVERATAGQPEYLRVLANFDSDHDRNLPKALELAREDLAQRKDIYGYDALAWALLKNDRPEEAAGAIAEALKLGTRDARLFYHAGMIHRRLGDRAKARDFLGRALALNPHFSPRQAEEARKALAELDAGKAGGDPRPPR
jgi:tetratricopeptide (TPR) repeat protein